MLIFHIWLSMWSLNKTSKWNIQKGKICHCVTVKVSHRAREGNGLSLKVLHPCVKHSLKSCPVCVSAQLTKQLPRLYYISIAGKDARLEFKEMKERGVGQGNHCEGCVFAKLSLEIIVIWLKPFRECVGRQKCRWKHCNENGNNNTAGQPSWIIDKHLARTFSCGVMKSKYFKVPPLVRTLFELEEDMLPVSYWLLRCSNYVVVSRHGAFNFLHDFYRSFPVREAFNQSVHTLACAQHAGNTNMVWWVIIPSFSSLPHKLCMRRLRERLLLILGLFTCLT